MHANEKRISPRGDDRNRGTRSIKLWVMDRSPPENADRWCCVVASIERTVYHYASQAGEFVRYKNRYHPVHAASEFDEILKMARHNKIQFMNMELYGRGDAMRLTESSAFIYVEEAGPLANIRI